ncbi:hypothetical protein T4B_4357 [Trichinella pseudospiralis]|uniref:Uncharacterized protein n=1 Tax=Trichinella pseudospiralis TaxID=6337 RepID=A0A0V1IZH4_TRIPS|nr:hypothetical protein T4A_2905 [Trichinella pseudospiralis]KRZ22056.1 hypothetical protein T4B_4357 [Trichinella pseudospiralis]KRZ28154.1 hypothetical protein T4C_5968 [Trichinella pseudospiralis]
MINHNTCIADSNAISNLLTTSSQMYKSFNIATVSKMNFQFLSERFASAEELDKQIFPRRRDRSASKRLPPVYTICLHSKPPRQARTRQMRRLLPSVAASLLCSVV